MASRFLLPIALLLCTSCGTSQGFHRDQLRESLESPPPSSTDKDIAVALSLKPQLPKPFKVGVFFKDPDQHGYRDPRWRWSEDDKHKIFSAAKPLQESGEISAIFQVSPTPGGATDLRSLRLAAAQHGADALLVVSGASDTDSYTNGWAWTYIALVPALFVPASRTDVLFLARASLWDVRNQFLYLTAEAESTAEQTRPAAFTNERAAIGQAKAESVERLSQELTKLAAALKAQPEGKARQAAAAPR